MKQSQASRPQGFQTFPRTQGSSLITQADSKLHALNARAASLEGTGGTLELDRLVHTRARLSL